MSCVPHRFPIHAVFTLHRPSPGAYNTPAGGGTATTDRPSDGPTGGFEQSWVGLVRVTPASRGILGHRFELPEGSIEFGA